MEISLPTLPSLQDCSFKGQRVVVRVDMNVPMQEGVISNQRRIVASLATVQYLLKQGAAVVLLSHLGRPREGQYDEKFSLAPVAAALSKWLKQPVDFVRDYLNGITVAKGQVALCENVRFNEGEESNSTELSKRLAALGDCFVMDAFGAAHRSHASTCGVIEHAPHACAGLLLMKEIEAVKKIMLSKQKPFGVILGGAKISDKLQVMFALVEHADWMVPAGGIANTLLASQGHTVGQSLYEESMLDQARDFLHRAQKRGVHVMLPEYVVCAKSVDGEPHVKQITAVDEDDMILDIAPQSMTPICKQIAMASTLLWNGPVGLFEKPAFSAGTQTIAKAIAASNAYSIAGGGDTLSSIDQFNIEEGISYISTGGGALLELIEGRRLPALEILATRKGTQ
ncbi:MAG: phosphoglycerate kinase [Candidatus Oxydemutatoraceae bacterium WSBS_2016_MAG_OTU14]